MHYKNKCVSTALLTCSFDFMTKLPISIVLSDVCKLLWFRPKQRRETVNTHIFHSVLFLPFLVGLSNVKTQRNLFKKS